MLIFSPSIKLNLSGAVDREYKISELDHNSMLILDNSEEYEVEPGSLEAQYLTILPPVDDFQFVQEFGLSKTKLFKSLVVPIYRRRTVVKRT